MATKKRVPTPGKSVSNPTSTGPALTNPGNPNMTRIAILQTGAGYRVRPSYVVTSRGTKVRFVNLTRDVVDLFVPDPVLFGSTVFSVASQDSLDVQVQTQSYPARYPYAVYSREISDFVPGESSPEIIIDR